MNQFEQGFLRFINNYYRDECTYLLEYDENLAQQAKSLISDPSQKLDLVSYVKTTKIASPTEQEISNALIKCLIKSNGIYLSDNETSKIGFHIKCTKKSLTLSYILDIPYEKHKEEEKTPLQFEIKTQKEEKIQVEIPKNKPFTLTRSPKHSQEDLTKVNESESTQNSKNNETTNVQNSLEITKQTNNSEKNEDQKENEKAEEEEEEEEEERHEPPKIENNEKEDEQENNSNNQQENNNEQQQITIENDNKSPDNDEEEEEEEEEEPYEAPKIENNQNTAINSQQQQIKEEEEEEEKSTENKEEQQSTENKQEEVKEETPEIQQQQQEQQIEEEIPVNQTQTETNKEDNDDELLSDDEMMAPQETQTQNQQTKQTNDDNLSTKPLRSNSNKITMTETNKYLLPIDVFPHEEIILSLLDEDREKKGIPPFKRDEYAQKKLMELHRRILLQSDKIEDKKDKFEDFNSYAPKQSRIIFTYNESITKENTFDKTLISEFFKKINNIKSSKNKQQDIYDIPNTIAIASVFITRDLISGVIMIFQKNPRGNSINLYYLSDSGIAEMLLKVLFFNINALRAKHNLAHVTRDNQLTEQSKESVKHIGKTITKPLHIQNNQIFLKLPKEGSTLEKSKDLVLEMENKPEYSSIILNPKKSKIGIGLWKESSIYLSILLQ